MTISRCKNYFFVLLILLSSIESFYQLSLMIQGHPPKRLKSFLFYLNLSPSALVFDRPNGFFRSMDLKIRFSDNTIADIHYEEMDTENTNYLERILKRRIFSNESKLNEKMPYLCNPDSIILIPFKLPKKIITETEIYSRNDASFSMKVPCKN